MPNDEEPPFGLLRLSVVLQEKGYKPAILDAHRGKMLPSAIEDVIYQLKPQTIGLNPTSVNLNEAAEIAEIAATKGIPLIIGGVHATLSPQQTFRDLPMVNVVVRGKGEIPLTELLRQLKNCPQIKGVYYKSDEISKRYDYADPYPLDEIPPIDYRIWVKNPIKERNLRIGDQTISLGEISLYETSGCPFECTYCSTPVLVGRNQGKRPYYKPSTEKLIKDVSLALETGANAIHFLDDMWFLGPKDFREFFELWLKEHSVFYWRGMTRAPIIEKFTNDDLRFMTQSGCWRIAIGVESGNQQMLDRIKKGITLEQVKSTISRLKKAGMPQIKAFFIMGFPDETLEQMLDTQNFIIKLKNLGLTDISLFQFKPYPGTEEWEYLKKNNPEILQHLTYLKTGKNKSSIVDHKLDTDATLPDDLKISQIPSGQVRELIEKTLEIFYS
ncbi:MAG: B12-binding domain-containing radical SAM protein [Patescibacteria group bacterium]|nr:B12-binding domain-containing radical SAM protein [Patescibacteria group bacterium]